MNDKVYAEQIKRIKRQYFINPNLSDEEVLREVKSIKDTLATTVPKDGRFRVSSAVFYYLLLFIFTVMQVMFFAIQMEYSGGLFYGVLSIISMTPLMQFAFNGLRYNKPYSILTSLVHVGVFIALRFSLPFILYGVQLTLVYTINDNFEDRGMSTWIDTTGGVVVFMGVWTTILAFIISILKRIDRFK